jgi:hypothetical protein
MRDGEHGAISGDQGLDPQQVRLWRTENGQLVVHLNGEQHTDLRVRLAFPLEATEEFVGLFAADGTELGMLERVQDLDADSRAVLRAELDKVYFRPRVTAVGRLVEEQGVLRGEILTTSGPRQIEIRGWRENVRLLSRDRAMIEDVDGNRYLVDNWRTLPKLTREILGL